MESALVPLSIGFLEYSVLRCLSDADGPLTRMEVAALLAARETTGSEAAIQRLLSKGLVEPNSSQAAAGTARICVTARGRARQTAAARALDKVSGTFRALLSNVDRAALDRILSNIHSSRGSS
jgi:hypothetical protein